MMSNREFNPYMAGIVVWTFCGFGGAIIGIFYPTIGLMLIFGGFILPVMVGMLIAAFNAIFPKREE